MPRLKRVLENVMASSNAIQNPTISLKCVDHFIRRH